MLEETWSSSSVLMVGEVIKLVFSVFMTLSDKGSTSAEGSGVNKLCWLVRASAPMSIPAVVFLVMNLLSYVSLNRVDASTFTVCAQVCAWRRCGVLLRSFFSFLPVEGRKEGRKVSIVEFFWLETKLAGPWSRACLVVVETNHC